MQTDNLELKKLVYLYLMNYAKSQPDMAIMAVNTFVKVRFFLSVLSNNCNILSNTYNVNLLVTSFLFPIKVEFLLTYIHIEWNLDFTILLGR